MRGGAWAAREDRSGAERRHLSLRAGGLLSREVKAMSSLRNQACAAPAGGHREAGVGVRVWAGSGDSVHGERLLAELLQPHCPRPWPRSSAACCKASAQDVLPAQLEPSASPPGPQALNVLLDSELHAKVSPTLIAIFWTRSCPQAAPTHPQDTRTRICCSPVS